MIGNLEYYKVFYYAASYVSITKAAVALSVSQPAVSQAIRQLEESLGAKLFIRASRGIRLTAEGEQLFLSVKKGYEEIEKGERQLRQMLDLESGEIRVGASDMTLRFYLLPFLEKYHEKYPHIKVTVTNAPTPETRQLLKEDQIDFGLITSPFEEQEELSPVDYLLCRYSCQQLEEAKAAVDKELADIAKQDGGAYSVRVNGGYLELYCPYGRSEALESWLANSSYQPMLVVLEGRKPLLEGAGL